MVFKDRRDAGKQLAGRLTQYRDKADVIVLGLPRGGVTVAAEIAQALRCPLDCGKAISSRRAWRTQPDDRHFLNF